MVDGRRGRECEGGKGGQLEAEAEAVDEMR